MIPLRFNPSTYSVKEGVDSNAVITLEALADHPGFAFTVTAFTQDGTAIREYLISLSYVTIILYDVMHFTNGFIFLRKQQLHG